MLRFLAICVAATCLCAAGWGDETDQFMTWGVELTDATPALNAYLNESIESMLKRVNGDPGRECDCETLTNDIFESIYLDRLRADLTHFVEDTEIIDVYPPREVPHARLMEMSIYRDVSFRLLIRVTRTIYVGEVYMGVDKLAHFFGIGRRYYGRYLRERRDGQSRDTAIEEAILWGLLTENTVLGRGINGIFSHADMEANFQGLRMALDFCESDSPYLIKVGESWTQTRPVNFADYVNPGFDESYNPPYYAAGLREEVLPVLTALYAGKSNSQPVTKRFRGYKSMTPSRSMTVIREYYRAETDAAPLQDPVFTVLKLSRDHPIALLDLTTSPGRPIAAQ